MICYSSSTRTDNSASPPVSGPAHASPANYQRTRLPAGRHIDVSRFIANIHIKIPVFINGYPVEQMLRYRGRIIITHLFKSVVIVLKLIVEEYIIDVGFGPTDLSCKRNPATLKLKILELYRQRMRTESLPGDAG